MDPDPGSALEKMDTDPSYFYISLFNSSDLGFENKFFFFAVFG